MEPITLCGAVIVMFGLWVEFESVVKILLKIIGTGRMAEEMRALADTVQKPVCGNRYVPYPR